MTSMGMRRGLCIGDSYGDVAEARRGGAVSGAHGLRRLAFAAIGRAPQRPVILVADGVARIPELGGDAAVAGILQHPHLLAILDLPAQLASELKMIPAVVDGPASVGLHENSVIGRGDEVVERPRSRQQ